MPRITFHSHSCFEIEGGGRRLLVDPFLSGNPLAKVGPGDFDHLDAILVTHGHGDHLGDTVSIARATGALVVSVFEVIEHYIEPKGLNAHSMHIGGGRDFDFGHLQWTIAHHGSTGPEGEALGNPAGFVLSIDGKKIYHAGDTALFLDMQLIGSHYGPLDLALLPIGDNYTMGIRDALKACEFLEPALTVPMHYNTFPPIEADPQDFARRAKEAGHAVRVLGVGESLDL